MTRLTAIILGILIACTGAFAHGRNCATANLFHHKQYNKSPLQASVTRANRADLFSITNCATEAYYNKVLSKKTEHFHIFYTLEGPHATKKEFVDSVAVNLERAYTMHTKDLGMHKPIGPTKTHHYNKDVDKGLYAVEIIELDLIRDASRIFNRQTCEGCFGLTLPVHDEYYIEDTDTTQLFIDNDFKYISPSTGKRKSMDDNPECTYIESSIPLTQQATGDDFSKNWNSAIRITSFHELYHASQLTYLNMYNYWTIWFEASATGVEEIGAPEVNDYFGYINNYLKNEKIIGVPLNAISDTFTYGVSPLYLYLYNNINKKFDHEIWEGFEKNPEKSLDQQLSSYLKKRKLNGDSVFHDFAVRLSFSGDRSKAIDSKKWLHKDEKDWNSLEYNMSPTFTPDTSRFMFDYYAGSQPDITNYKGDVSAVVYRDGKAKIIPVKTTNTADSIYSTLSKVDSIVWVFSRFGESDFVETIVTNTKLRAYPTPWREGSLCFTPLPRDKDYVEIRNRRGAIVMHEKYQGTLLCIEENKVREKMAPGVYWFRAGNSGKAEKFMIVY